MLLTHLMLLEKKFIMTTYKTKRLVKLYFNNFIGPGIVFV